MKLKNSIDGFIYNKIYSSEYANYVKIKSKIVSGVDNILANGLDIISLNFNKTFGDSIVKCRCKCQNVFERVMSKMFRVKSCGCDSPYQKGELNPRFTGKGLISGKRFSGIKSNARHRNIPFNVTLEFVWNKFLEQNRICVLSGRLLNESDMSLDRIDPKKGYEETNVQWVHKDVNELKWDLTENELISWCKRISSPIKSTREYLKIHKYTNNYAGVGNVSSTYFSDIRTKAISRNIMFDITIDDMWNKFISQCGKCAITGVRLRLKYKDQTASLDRIDSKKGYTIDNIQWVHKIINSTMKKDFEETYFINLCKEIYEHQINK